MLNSAEQIYFSNFDWQYSDITFAQKYTDETTLNSTRRHNVRSQAGLYIAK